VNSTVKIATLWRPTGPDELALVEASGWRRWPPRLPEQPIFYPVLNEDYATMIARDWNVKQSERGTSAGSRFGRSSLERPSIGSLEAAGGGPGRPAVAGPGLADESMDGDEGGGEVQEEVDDLGVAVGAAA
jgi:hypothetical protein